MENQTQIKRYLVFCEPCSYKRILTSDTPDDMVPIKQADVPGGSPRLEAGKTVSRPAHKQSAKVKCPQCGRGVVVKVLPDVYSKAYQEVDDRQRKNKEDKEKRQRIEDGMPVKRSKDVDFMG